MKDQSSSEELASPSPVTVLSKFLEANKDNLTVVDDTISELPLKATGRLFPGVENVDLFSLRRVTPNASTDITPDSSGAQEVISVLIPPGPDGLDSKYTLRSDGAVELSHNPAHINHSPAAPNEGPAPYRTLTPEEIDKLLEGVTTAVVPEGDSAAA